MTTFRGHSRAALNEWFHAVETGDVERCPTARAEGLVIRLQGNEYAFSGVDADYDAWMSAQITLHQHLRINTPVQPTLPLFESGVLVVEREFGTIPTAAEVTVSEAVAELEEDAQEIAYQIASTEELPEAVAAVDPVVSSGSMPCDEEEVESREPEQPTAPEAESESEPEPQPETPQAPKRAKIVEFVPIATRVEAYLGELPQSYEVMRNVLTLMIRERAQEDAMRYVLNQAVEAHAVNCLPEFAALLEQYLHTLVEKELDLNTSYVKMVNSALKKTCVQPGDDTQQAIYRRVMELAHEEAKPRVKAFLDKLFTTGDAKYLVPAWKQVSAALAEKRTDTPVRLLQSIIKDLAHAAEVEENRPKPRLTTKDYDWVRKAVPEPHWLADGPEGKQSPQYLDRMRRYDSDARQWIDMGFVPWDEIMGEWGMETDFHCLMRGDLARKYKDKRFGFIYTKQQYEDVVIEFLNTALDNIRELDGPIGLSALQLERVKSQVKTFMDRLLIIMDSGEVEYLEQVRDKIEALYDEGFREKYERKG